VFGTLRTLQLIITFTVITNIGVEGEIASMGWGTPEVDEMFQATLIGTIGCVLIGCMLIANSMVLLWGLRLHNAGHVLFACVIFAIFTAALQISSITALVMALNVVNDPDPDPNNWMIAVTDPDRGDMVWVAIGVGVLFSPFYLWLCLANHALYREMAMKQDKEGGAAPLSISITLISGVVGTAIIVITLWKDPIDVFFNFGR